MGGPPIGFDIVVYRDDGSEVWRNRPHGITIADGELVVEMARGETLTLSATWPQTVGHEGPLRAPPGAYHAIGFLHANDRVMQTGKVPFRIRAQ